MCGFFFSMPETFYTREEQNLILTIVQSKNFCSFIKKVNVYMLYMLQSCPTLCNSINGSPPGFPVPGILQARTLEWVAISFSTA